MHTASVAALTMRGIRCLIVDDNRAFLRAAQVLLEREGLVIVGIASNGSEAVRLAEELRPDVVTPGNGR